jgi:hypothetical protein
MLLVTLLIQLVKISQLMLTYTLPMTKKHLICTHVILSCYFRIVSALLKAQWHIVHIYITSCCCDITMVTLNHLQFSISKRVRQD